MKERGPEPKATSDGVEPPSTIPAQPAAGTESPALPGYELLEVLGRGGMGAVYRARQMGLDRFVAVKMLIAGSWATPSQKARFLTEVRAIARLRHPNIVQIFEVGEASGHPYFSMEYCAAGTLADRLKAGPLSPPDAARVVRQLARGIQHAHQQSIIHRDLKPANVLLMENGTVKVADFGLAKLTDTVSHTVTGDLMGTPGYMAPEQASGEGNIAGAATDIWGLGAILYACLTGSPPFPGKGVAEAARRVLTDRVVPPRTVTPDVPRDLEVICLKCLEKAPRHRYVSAEALADDLDRFLAGRPVVARPIGQLRRTSRWVRRNPVVTALASLLIVATVGLIALAFSGSGRSARENQAAPQDDMVEVVVAMKDLPIGTLFTREELPRMVMTKKVPRDAAPAEFTSDIEEFVGKRLSRTVRAGEAFNPRDLNAKLGLTIPLGMNVMSLRIGADDTMPEFVAPGSKVDILAVVRIDNTSKVVPILVEVLVLAVEMHVNPAGGPTQTTTVSIAVTREQAIILSLARARGCQLHVMMRNPETPADPKFDAGKVFKILESIPEPNEIAPPPRLVSPKP